MKTVNLLLILIIIFFFSCAPQKVDLVKEKKAISDLLEKNFQAYLKGNLEEATETTADDFLLLSEGNIERITKEEMKESLSKRFKKEKESKQYAEGFTVTDSVQVSEDGKMAWAIKELKATFYKDSSKVEIKKKFTQVLLVVLEKRNYKWVVLANSTSSKED